MVNHWSFLLAAVGITGLYLTTRRNWRGYLIGVLAQLLWVVYAVTTRQWGFIASALAYGTVNAVGIWAWRHPQPHPPTYEDGSWACPLCARRVPAGKACDGTDNAEVQP